MGRKPRRGKGMDDPNRKTRVGRKKALTRKQIHKRIAENMDRVQRRNQQEGQ